MSNRLMIRLYAGSALLTGIANTQGGLPASAGERHRIVVQHCGKCLDVGEGRQEAPRRRIQWVGHAGAHQQSTMARSGRKIVIRPAHNLTQALNLEGGATGNNAEIQQSPTHGGLNQTWVPRRTDSVLFHMIPLHSGKAADRAGTLHENGVLHQRFELYGSDNQRSRFEITRGNDLGFCNARWPTVPHYGESSIISTRDDRIVFHSSAGTPGSIRLVFSKVEIRELREMEIYDSTNQMIGGPVRLEDRNLAEINIPLNGRDPARWKVRFLRRGFLGLVSAVYTFCDLSAGSGRTLWFRWTPTSRDFLNREV